MNVHLCYMCPGEIAFVVLLLASSSPDPLHAEWLRAIMHAGRASGPDAASRASAGEASGAVLRD